MSTGVVAGERRVGERTPNHHTTRAAGLDAFRGLAIVAMLVDHVTLIVEGPDVLRNTIGRLAVPGFFLLAGHLARTPRLRHLLIAMTGVCLTLVVPWLDSPNVLTLWAVGVVVLWGMRTLGLPLWLLPVVGLTLLANGYSIGGHGTGFYDPLGLWGLMAVGATLPRHAFTWTMRIPAPVRDGLAGVGRHPIAWYAGHLVALGLLGAVTGWW